MEESRLLDQIVLLLWKRRQELLRQPWEVVKLILAPLFVFALLVLIYESFNKPYPIFPAGFLEPYIIPIAFWVIVMKTVVYVMNEKQMKLQESMRMMGMRDESYWVSLFLSEAVFEGFVVSLLCNLFSIYKPCPDGFDFICSPDANLYNMASWGSIFCLYFSYCLSAVPMSFLISCFFDTAQTAGQATLALLLVLYVVFCATLIESTDPVLLSWCCVMPPMALQVGALTLAAGPGGQSGAYPSIQRVCGILLADVVLYSTAAWYLSEVWPNKNGANKPWNFCFNARYWWSQFFPTNTSSLSEPLLSKNPALSDVEAAAEAAVTTLEPVDENLTGRPSISARGLTRFFGAVAVVDNLSFQLYQDQIFCLLGHNGAGKTTTINLLTGSLSPSAGTASVYGHDISSEMQRVRQSLGLCPQHDVLFENLTVAEHIVFFSRLKGFSWDAAFDEATRLTDTFHLSKRHAHRGGELSGGQRRKLSVAIAVCGGSKLVVLDEPTAGMDPLARRELWDLLSSLRTGRTILLTTHYMDECEVLGDRIGIMNLGKIVCVGSCLFLKKRYGAGYRLIFEKGLNWVPSSERVLEELVKKFVPGAMRAQDELNATESCSFLLPFSTESGYSALFALLEGEGVGSDGSKVAVSSCLAELGAAGFGLSISSLEEVFLKVGGDDSVTPKPALMGPSSGIGGVQSDQGKLSLMKRQVVGIMRRRLVHASRDFVTIPLVLLPVGGAVASAVLYSLKVIENPVLQAFALSAIYMGTYLGVPGLISEFLVREKESRLRNLLIVCGTDFRAYWLGNCLGDLLLLAPALLVTYVSWGAADMTGFISSPSNAAGGFFIFFVFLYELVGFSYLASQMFSSPKAAASFMPLINLGLLMLPLVCIMLGVWIFVSVLRAVKTVEMSDLIGSILWGVCLTSPFGGLLVSLMDVSADFGSIITGYPSYESVLAVMLLEGTAFFFAAYQIDCWAVSSLHAQLDPLFDNAVLQGLDADVDKERRDTLGLLQGDAALPSSTSETVPLLLARLRKVFPSKSKKSNSRPVVAAEDVSFTVQPGEIFGLLGANGAGKSTTISMCTRHLVPTAGCAYIRGVSVLERFPRAAQHLGVVTQNNALWDLLTVEDHLYLFCRLRGVAEDVVEATVVATIDQLELTPHRYKLASQLSGGMKRKLCVAAALIGDPQVVLLDEPSAGLDPKSRRNLWDVVLRTMAQRSVVLTTHSMEEAEALCNRIGIMVRGQLHALGTKQHIKRKFGQGYELVVRLSSSGVGSGLDDASSAPAPASASASARAGAGSAAVAASAAAAFHSQRVNRLVVFIQSGFPNAQLLNANASLVTFRLGSGSGSDSDKHTEAVAPAAAAGTGAGFSVGRLFTLLGGAEAIALGIDDWSVTQATLEQCFIRVVAANAEGRKAKPSAGQGRGREIRSCLHGHHGADVPIAVSEIAADPCATSPILLTAEDEDEEDAVAAKAGDPNCCGCYPWQLSFTMRLFLLAFVVMVFVALAGRGSQPTRFSGPVAMVCLFLASTMCCFLHCPCCRVAGKGLDE